MLGEKAFLYAKLRKHSSCLFMTIYNHLNSWNCFIFHCKQGPKISRLSYACRCIIHVVKICTECIDYSVDFFWTYFEQQWWWIYTCWMIEIRVLVYRGRLHSWINHRRQKAMFPHFHTQKDFSLEIAPIYIYIWQCYGIKGKIGEKVRKLILKP